MIVDVMDVMCNVDGRCDGMWCRVMGYDVLWYGVMLCLHWVSQGMSWFFHVA